MSEEMENIAANVLVVLGLTIVATIAFALLYGVVRMVVG